MGKDAGEPVAEVARRRLELLGEELARAGLAPVHADEPAPGPAVPAPDAVTPAVVPEPGRHARDRRSTIGPRWAGWVHDRLPPALQGRVALGATHLVLLGAVLALALAAAAIVVLRSSPEGQQIERARPARALVSTAPRPGAVGDPPAAPSGASSPATVVVDVAGKVRRPGVTTLPAGSRVIDAIHKAGGPRHGVSLTSLNLARVLVDGEQIRVGLPDVAPRAGGAAGAPGAGAAEGPLVNLNSATQAQLEALPGVGPVTAGRIVAWRAEHGAFTSIEDLLEVDGIGEKTLAELTPHLTL
ncbi:MAG TPA: ComEA family DNA-binding protein [Marmoricola sp.]|jgi:competence protein ComEA|nr:ComEA family DNA-binding protein [Marmoricola sp.]